MDGLPRVSMVAVPLKVSREVPDLTLMRRDIELGYQTSADDYKDEFNEFLRTRKEACAPSIDYTGLSKQKRYYAQLQLVKGRFRLSCDSTAVTWTWSDAITNNILSSSDFQYEEAAILFNIGALHSALGTKESRTDADSMKVACTHFQCAASAFDTVFERYLALETSVDLDRELLRAFGLIMMAQAQECFVEKSILDNRMANTTAKLTQYLTVTYEQAASQLALPSLVSSLPSKFQKDLLCRCRLKSAYYAALTAYYSGASDDADKKYGRAIAWYQVAQQHIVEAEKIGKTIKDSEPPLPVSPGGPLLNNVRYIADLVQNRLNTALRDNQLIYHDSVPSPDSLDSIKPACLVKGISFDPNDPEIRGADIFRRLVPMKTLEATSVYSEKKASLLRAITAEVEEKDLALQQFLTSIDLDPNTMLAPDSPIPQEFFDVCAIVGGLEKGVEEEFSTKTKGLTEASDKTQDAVRNAQEKCYDVKARLEALSAIKSTDELKTLTPRVRAITERLEAMGESLKHARQCNIQLGDVFTAHLDVLKQLVAPVDEITSSLSSVQTITNDATALQILKASQQLFSKVDEMSRQRADFVQQLRHALHEDDVTSDLLTTHTTDAASVESLFENRLKKHDSLIGLIRQNLSAQHNIESALMELNAKFAPQASELRKLRKRRAEELGVFISSGQTFGELMEKIRQGLGFYEQTNQCIETIVNELDKFSSKIDDVERKIIQSVSPDITASVAPPPARAVAGSGAFPTLSDYMASIRLSKVAPTVNTLSTPAMPVTTNVAPTQPRVPFQPGSGSSFQPQLPASATTQAFSAPPTHISSSFASPQWVFMPTQPYPTPQFPPSHTLGPNVIAPSQRATHTEAPTAPGPQPYIQRFPPSSVSGIATAQQPVPMGGLIGTPPVQWPVCPPPMHPNQFGQSGVFPASSGFSGQPPTAARHFYAINPSISYGSPPSTLPQPGTIPELRQPRSFAPNYSIPPSCLPAGVRQSQPYYTAAHVPNPPSSTVAGGMPPNVTLPSQRVTQPYGLMTQQVPPKQCVSSSQQQQQQPDACMNMQPIVGDRGPPFVPIPPHWPQVHSSVGIGPPSGVPPEPQLLRPGPHPTIQQTRIPLDPSFSHNPQPPLTAPLPGTQPVFPSTHPVVRHPQSGIAYGPHPAFQAFQPQRTPWPASNMTASGFERTVRPEPRFPPQNFSAASPVPQTYPLSSSPAAPSTRNQNVDDTSTVKSVPQLDTTNHAVSIDHTGLTDVSGSLEPLQPQVLTKADFDNKRREERLRASYTTAGTAISAASEPQPLPVVVTTSLPTTRVVSTVHPATDLVSSSRPGSNSLLSHTMTATSQSSPKPVQPEPLSDPLTLNRFITSTESLLTWLEKLDEPMPGTTQSPNKPAPTRLDIAWTKVTNRASDYANSPLFKGKKPTQAAALCCPTKNRHRDYVPFDLNRVVLESVKNDYINASHVDLMGFLGEWCPRYIVTQAPMPKTTSDYWNMIISQGCEVVVLLLPPKPSRAASPFSSLSTSSTTGEGTFGDPTDPLHVPPHLPINKVGSRFTVPGSSIELRLQAIKECDAEPMPCANGTTSVDTVKRALWTERILTVQNHDTQQTRSLVHLHFHEPILQSITCGTGVLDDRSSANLCTFINHVHTYYKQQRSLVHPIAVACEYGAGLSGIFVTASVSLLHAELLGRLADVTDIAGLLCQQRRGILNHPSQLVTAARVIAHAAVETAARRDIVVGPRRPSPSARVPSGHPAEKAGSDPKSRSNVVDTLFSQITLPPSELMSVIDKWSKSDATPPPISVVDTNTEAPTVTSHANSATCANGVSSVPFHGVDADGGADQPFPIDAPAHVPSQPAMSTSFDHLIELSSLAAASSPTRFKRYTRRDFEAKVSDLLTGDVVAESIPHTSSTDNQLN